MPAHGVSALSVKPKAALFLPFDKLFVVVISSTDFRTGSRLIGTSMTLAGLSTDSLAL